MAKFNRQRVLSIPEIRNMTLDDVIMKAKYCIQVLKRADSKILPMMEIKAETLNEFIEILEAMKVKPEDVEQV